MKHNQPQLQAALVLTIQIYSLSTLYPGHPPDVQGTLLLRDFPDLGSEILLLSGLGINEKEEVDKFQK